MSTASEGRHLTRRGYSREDARVWREPDIEREDSAPQRLQSVLRLEDWGVSQEQAASMLRERRCPACGEGPWKSVLTHMSKRHGYDRFTVRELCGMNTTEVLASPSLSASRSALSKAQSERLDMSALAARPRKKYRHTTAGLAALAANLETEAAEKGRRSPEARERLAESVRAMWGAMPEDEKAERLSALHRARGRAAHD